MSTETGKISVQTEDIFPIIKKYLYSDTDIFLRELIANAMDASTKLKVLSSRGEYDGELGDMTVNVHLDEEAKTLTISDRGIGMSEEEVKKYLNQVAFSSATEFLEKYKEDSGIIGHFGLGFYSAFMVASKVEVRTKSYKDNEVAVQWTCEGTTDYTIETIEKEGRGTDIILHIDEENEEYLKKDKIDGLLGKYCQFLPTEIQFGTKTETTFEGEGDDRKEIKTEVPNIINNVHPAWKKSPSDLTDEDYLAFYQELYPYSEPPLFWIHLNIDYPFDLTGILYFPKIKNRLEVQKNKIQLYSNQVFVTDDISEIVPEFLTLLHGVIDSPDIPLNVSRSYLQSDKNVKKISGYITKKVSEKLKALFKEDRKAYEEKWDEISIFVKYGIISDEKFDEKTREVCLFKNIEGEYFTIEEYLEKIDALQTDKNERRVVIYTNGLNHHDSYVRAAKEKGYDIVVFDTVIDNHFLQHLESKLDKVSFVRVDSGTADQLIDKDEKTESVLSDKEVEKVKTLFTDALGDKASVVQTEALAPDAHPVVITKPEFMRRMEEMQQLQGMNLQDGPQFFNVVINTNHPLVAEKLLKMRSAEKKEKFVKYLYNLARLNQNMLQGGELTDFVQQSLEFVEK